MERCETTYGREKGLIDDFILPFHILEFKPHLFKQEAGNHPTVTCCMRMIRMVLFSSFIYKRNVRCPSDRCPCFNASSTSVVPSDCQDIDCSMFSFFFTMTTAKQELW